MIDTKNATWNSFYSNLNEIHVVAEDTFIDIHILISNQNNSIKQSGKVFLIGLALGTIFKPNTLYSQASILNMNIEVSNVNDRCSCDLIL